MFYKQISQEERDLIVANAMYDRETEHYYHAHNKAVYEALLETLPKDKWPEDLKRYQIMTADQLRQQMLAPGEEEQAKKASKYAWRDQIRLLLVSTCEEMAKVENIYKALEMQLPVERRASVIEEAINKRKANGG